MLEQKIVNFAHASQHVAGVSVLLVTGPTAGGKTALVDRLAQEVPIAMINADMGQFYQPLSIGTAKPDWRSLPYPCFLFDVIASPVSLGVVQFRSMVLDAVAQAQAMGRLPVLVGGSQFYLHSLFWPPADPIADAKPQALPSDVVTPEQRWQFLADLDPVRAAAIHPRDTYRVDRALEIWQTCGVLPSSQLPQFQKLWDRVAVWYVHPGKEPLLRRIAQRTGIMLEQGWLQEAEVVMQDSGWQEFISRKGFIGYPEIMSWLTSGKQKKDYKALVEAIIIQTNQYARRQEKYWQRFSRNLATDAPADWPIMVVDPMQ